MIAVGIGFQGRATGAEIVDAIDVALAAKAIGRNDIGMLATARFKRGSLALSEAASKLGVAIRYLDEQALQRCEARLLTYSKTSSARTGVSCLSEAAALAALDGDGCLLAPRLVHGPVTCALATGNAS
ncbi:MAG: cobalamin biosynthesis protein [Rhizobiaceae bacterium]